MDNVPESFNCPLTGSIMSDPVMDPEGNTYEHSAILEWLSKQTTSPITRTHLTAQQLIPNRALRDSIEEFKRGYSPKEAIGIENLEIENKEVEAEVVQNELPPSQELIETISLKMSSRCNVTADGSEERLVMTEVKVPEGSARTPSNIVCVVDISGSMDVNVTTQNEHGDKEAHNLSILDIVKHAVKTIIGTLRPCDRLSLVKYNQKATEVFGLLTMDDAGKKRAIVDLERLRAGGQTNIWDGLLTAMEVLRKGASTKKENRLNSIMLLTDGCPNVVPPRGHVPMLDKYRKENPSLLFNLNTFGFGYNLDSVLLRELAEAGGGTYSFIPDAGFVGTCFVHAVSGLLVNITGNSCLTLTVEGDAELLGISPALGHSSKGDATSITIPLGTLQYGQSRHVLVQMRAQKCGQAQFAVSASLTFNHWRTGPQTCSAKLADLQDEKECRTIDEQHCRLAFVDAIHRALNVSTASKDQLQVEVGRQVIADAIKFVKSKQGDNPIIAALLQDLEGQVMEAMSKDAYFSKWGCHYLPSLARAHLLQQCNNFKDPGIQHYGGSLFSQVRDEADDIFMSLPPPEPPKVDIPVELLPSGRGFSAQRAAPRPVNMRVFNNRNSGCISGDSLVMMANGELRAAQSIRQGDLVRTLGDKQVATVRCVVKALCQDGVSELVQLPGGLKLTPYHPVLLPTPGTKLHKWQFPIDLGPVREVRCPAVFNFVLSHGHALVINGLPCVTLGHGFTQDCWPPATPTQASVEPASSPSSSSGVVAHQYFGTEAVVKDLQQMRGWPSGLVQFAPGCLLRHPDTGRLFRYSNAHEISGW